MDSIYEQPRTAPLRSSTREVPAFPVVPEVSMVFLNEPSQNKSTMDSIYLSYNDWKSRNKQNGEVAKSNFYVQQDMKQTPASEFVNAQCFTKQVRFQSPGMLQKSAPKKIGSSEAFLKESVEQRYNHGLLIPEKQDKCQKPFEQIYMANIPNRHLDLSIIEPPNNTVENKENFEKINPNIILNHKNVEKSDEQYKYISNLASLKQNEGYHDKKITESNNPVVIDLYNYKRGSNEYNSVPANRQTLDNLMFPNSLKKIDSLDGQTQKNAPSCLYNSFDSHRCENNQNTCNCPATKQVNNNASPAEKIITTNDQKSEEPTVKELLKIIHQQNDQLIILQQQVASLIANRNSPPKLEAPPPPNNNINVCRTSTQLETQQGAYNPLQKRLAPRKGALPHFSLDVMTSFEVSIRRQQNLNRAYKETMNKHPQICEITENEIPFECNRLGNILDGIKQPMFSPRDNMDVSLTLNEPVLVPETCPTPENTIQIDMDDYSSDDDEPMTDNRWFYKSMKGQVNQILRKSGIWSNDESPYNESATCDNVTQNMRKKVKDATIKHLKSIGVHVPHLDDVSDNFVGADDAKLDHNSNEISFAVKQLLMKYLPNEQLAKLACMQTQATANVEQTGLIKRRPEFSFASVQYMQKYNLLTDPSTGAKIDQQCTPLGANQQFNRILDITAIKQQPKLL